MSIEIRPPGEDEVPNLFHVDGRNFGFSYESDTELEAALFDWSRFRCLYDDGDLVGMAASFAFDVTVPGGSTVPAGGITWVSVAATHRRRGHMRALMDAVHADLDERGEPLAVLGASEGGIYRRLGYGVATWDWFVEIDRHAARLRAPAGGHTDHGVSYAKVDAAMAHIERCYETGRRLRAGEISRSGAWWRLAEHVWSKPQGETSEAFVLLHADGYALYRVESNWVGGEPRSKLLLREFMALTPAAHRALWEVLLGVDLCSTISSVRAMPIDDPLSKMLDNHRAVRTTGIVDGVWARPMDVAICFGARTYGTDDSIVLEIEVARYRIDGSPDGAAVTRVRTRPDLTVTLADAGSLLFGGTRIGPLVASGNATARSPEAARRADHFFTALLAPTCSTQF